MTATKCVYCGTTDDLRPYGPHGVPICFDCMKEDPDREAEASFQFGQLYDHAEIVGHGLVTLTGAGLVPGNLAEPVVTEEIQ